MLKLKINRHYLSCVAVIISDFHIYQLVSTQECDDLDHIGGLVLSCLTPPRDTRHSFNYPSQGNNNSSRPATAPPQSAALSTSRFNVVHFRETWGE